VISTLLLYLGMGVGLLTLLDMFLSDHQKAAIQGASIAAWNWIDNVKQLSFMNWFKRPLPRNLFPIAAAFLVVIPVFELKEMDVVLLYGGVGAIVARLLLELLLRARTWRAFILRASISLVVPAIPVALLALFLNRVDTDLGPINVLIAVILFLFIWLAFAFWAIAMAPFVIALVAAVALSVAELITRRIAENSKGPILFASAIFSAAMLIFKIFA
jgi:hypothetical protein